MFPLLSLYERFLGLLSYEEFVLSGRYMSLADHRQALEMKESSYDKILSNLLERGYILITPSGVCLSDRGVVLSEALDFIVAFDEEHFSDAIELEDDPLV